MLGKFQKQIWLKKKHKLGLSFLVDNHQILKTGFPFHFSESGGNSPSPLRGGHKRGDSGPKGGEWHLKRSRQLALIDIEIIQ